MLDENRVKWDEFAAALKNFIHRKEFECPPFMKVQKLQVGEKWRIVVNAGGLIIFEPLGDFERKIAKSMNEMKFIATWNEIHSQVEMVIQ